MIRWFRYAFWAAAAFAFVVATLPHPVELPGNPSDKVQHVAAFAVLAWLAAAGYRQTPMVRLGLGLSLFGVLIECAQAVPALNRDADWIDWVADTASAAAVLSLVFLYRVIRHAAHAKSRADSASQA